MAEVVEELYAADFAEFGDRWSLDPVFTKGTTVERRRPAARRLPHRRPTSGSGTSAGRPAVSSAGGGGRTTQGRRLRRQVEALRARSSRRCVRIDGVTLPTPLLNGIDPPGNSFVVWDRKIVYMSVTKAACTTLRWMIADLAGEDLERVLRGPRRPAEPADDHPRHAHAWQRRWPLLGAVPPSSSPRSPSTTAGSSSRWCATRGAGSGPRGSPSSWSGTPSTRATERVVVPLGRRAARSR